MAKRGRKSANELTTPGAVAVIRRPEPLLDLTPEQAEVWQSVVDALPADWFSAENHPLLAQYCRHTVAARHLAQWIDQEEALAEPDYDKWSKMTADLCKHTAALKALAASMRLAQQARYQARGAERAKGRVGSVRRPWETT